MLDGQIVTIKQKVWGNEHIQISPQNIIAESTYVAEDINLNIIHEDDAIIIAVSYTHLRAHETVLDLVCRLLLDKKKHYNSISSFSL